MYDVYNRSTDIIQYTYQFIIFIVIIIFVYVHECCSFNNNYNYNNCFYHQGKGYTRGVTKPQFERVLHFACLSVTPEEMNVRG